MYNDVDNDPELIINIISLKTKALRQARGCRLTPEAEGALYQTLIAAAALIAAIIDVVALITQISTSVASGAAVIP